jgi:hypothetical protein
MVVLLALTTAIHDNVHNSCLNNVHDNNNMHDNVGLLTSIYDHTRTPNRATAEAIALLLV